MTWCLDLMAASCASFRGPSHKLHFSPKRSPVHHACEYVFGSSHTSTHSRFRVTSSNITFPVLANRHCFLRSCLRSGLDDNGPTISPVGLQASRRMVGPALRVVHGGDNLWKRMCSCWQHNATLPGTRDTHEVRPMIKAGSGNNERTAWPRTMHKTGALQQQDTCRAGGDK